MKNKFIVKYISLWSYYNKADVFGNLSFLNFYILHT